MIDAVFFLFRLALIAVYWVFIWKWIYKPTSASMRILRLVLLVAGLFGVLTMLRLTGYDTR